MVMVQAAHTDVPQVVSGQAAASTRIKINMQCKAQVVDQQAVILLQTVMAATVLVAWDMALEQVVTAQVLGAWDMALEQADTAQEPAAWDMVLEQAVMAQEPVAWAHTAQALVQEHWALEAHKHMATAQAPVAQY